MAKLTGHRRELFPCLVIVGVVLALGLYLGAWTGWLKGDDAYLHAGRVQYVIDSFPHLGWYHQFFAGYPLFRFEAPAYHLTVALAHVVTGVPIEPLMQAGLFLSMAALGLSAYLLARSLGLSRLPATGFSLLVFTMSLTWNWLVIGGAYVRVTALPFLFLSVAMVYRHTKEIDQSRERLSTYVATVGALSLLATLHPLLWQWAFLMVAAIYVLAVRGWRKRLYHMARVFLPLTGLVAWLYLPLLRTYPAAMGAVGGAVAHDTSLMEWRWLADVPAPGTWSISLGPLIVPLALVGLALTFLYLRRLRWALGGARPEVAAVAVLMAFSLIFFAFGWLPMPQQLYRMAAYDYAMWLGLSLTLLSAFVFALLARSGVFASFGRRARAAAHALFLVAVIASSVATLPFLQFFSQVGGPISSKSVAHEVRKVVDVARAKSPPDLRLHNFQRVVTRWLYYVSPDIKATGGRSNLIPHEFYQQWANSAVSYRLNTSEVDRIYHEDAPRVLRPSVGGEENFYPAAFWLDWYGASGPVLLPPVYPQWQTAQGYAHRPQLFEEYQVATELGDLFYFRYPESSPIAISPRALVVAVPFLPEDAPAFYVDLLDLLSSLNLSSRWVVPVKLDDVVGLERFDTALVRQSDYAEHRDVLEQFAVEGGHLVVMADESRGANVQTVRMLNPGLSFTARVAPVSPRPDGTVLAETDSGPLVYRSAMGRGTLTVSGVSLASLVESSPVGALLLAEALDPSLNVEEVAADLDSSRVSWSTDGLVLGVARSVAKDVFDIQSSDWAVSWSTDKATGLVDGSGGLVAQFSGGDAHDQVNFGTPLSGPVSVKAAGIVEFDIWSDGSPLVDVSFVSEAGDRYNSHSVKLRAGEWVHNVIPFSAFRFPVGDFDEASQVVFSVNDNPAAGLSGHGERVELRVKELRVASGPDGDGAPALQIVPDYSGGHIQANWELPLERELPASSNALLTFSLWNDGARLSGISVTLQSTESPGYLYYDLPESTWTGWREFTVPLSYFRWKEGETIDSFDSVAICFNDDPPYDSRPEIRQFMVREVAVVTLPAAAGYDRLNGEWQEADRFVLALGERREVLWKQSYMPSWRVTDDHGRRVDYYFAGPGMMYLVAPEGASSLTFEMPLPMDRLVGLGISLASMGLFGAYVAAKRLSGRKVAD